ncbi:uncharacterized protein LOC110864156 [Helianthus annuus]|uniref:uncharacterized protein LOC110864156 n=1 Tax=Helianthus annuus TaxID=4232 RepID=UPI000B8F9959|nr:uncharacterized protein LOC110864156 [Helianthus annuus]
MPTLTTIALQNLVEHRTSSRNSSTLNNPLTTHIQTSNANRRLDVFEVQSGGNGEEKMLDSCLFDSDDDGFADARCDSVSIASSIDVDDDFGRLGFEDMSVVSNQIGDYYDAVEDFSSDGSMSSIASCRGNLELELRSTRLNLLVEIEKRKAAEDDVAAMFTHWHRVSNFLLAPSSSDCSSTIQFDINAVKQLSEEVIVARFVADSLGKAEAKAEAELAAQVIIASKDKEICRLRDRMQYYEAMIHEMSQNNLESMEVARRHRERKRGHRKWLWGCIGMSIAIGASIIAYSYTPNSYALESVGDTQPEAA